MHSDSCRSEAEVKATTCGRCFENMHPDGFCRSRRCLTAWIYRMESAIRNWANCHNANAPEADSVIDALSKIARLIPEDSPNQKQGER